MLNSTQQPHFKVTSRSRKDHLNSILSTFKSKTNKELKASIIEAETTELNVSLEEVLSAKTDYDIKFSKLDDKKKQKTEDDKNSADTVRNKFMERLSETKKREAVELQMKRARNNGSETIQLMKEKYENEREIRMKELKLKKQELELKAKEPERN